MSSTSRIRRWWTEEEDQVLRREADFQLSQGSLNDWNRIAAKLPGRTNKDCRKRWSKIPGHIKKGIWSNAEDQKLKNAVETFGYRWTHVAQSLGTRNADQCAKRWHHSLDPTLDHSEWVPQEDARLFAAVASYGRVWKTIGEKEFPGRSPTELKNRFVIMDRKRQQLASSSAPETAAQASTGSASSHPKADVEDSESTNSLSDDDGADTQETDFNSDFFSNATSSHTTPASTLPSHNVSSHIASSLTTPGSYFPSHNVSPSLVSQNFSLADNEFSANLPAHQDSNDLFSDSSAAFFNQNDSSISTGNRSIELQTPWNMTQFSMLRQNGDDAMTGLDLSPGKNGSTMILEDVQPQMVTSIINLLFESKSVVKMKIVSDE